MKIAIIGAGFSGLATTWHLLQQPSVEIDVYDSVGIAGGASGLAAGLLHPYGGLRAKKNPHATEGYQATLDLLKISSDMLKMPVFHATGLLRPALTSENQHDFSLCAQTYPDVAWWDAEQCQKVAPGLPPVPGLWIPSAIVVDSPLYLQGLWLACQTRGARLIPTPVDRLDMLSAYDRIVVCAGAATLSLLKGYPLSLTLVKGQILELEWPSHLPPLQVPLNSYVYLLNKLSQQTCIVGSTYERDFTHALPAIDRATQDILPKLRAMYPPLATARIVNCRAGIRVSTPNHQPLIKQIDAKTWVLTGMGSKGLLYHALWGKNLRDR